MWAQLASSAKVYVLHKYLLSFFLTSSVQRCEWVFLSWLFLSVLVAAGSCWNYFTRHIFFFYILNQFSPIESHIKRTQKKFHVTSANEITIAFIPSNQKHAWSLLGCTALAAVSDNQWTKSGNYHKLIAVQFNCGKPFMCIHVGVAAVVGVHCPSNLCELALGAGINLEVLLALKHI